MDISMPFALPDSCCRTQPQRPLADACIGEPLAQFVAQPQKKKFEG